MSAAAEDAVATILLAFFYSVRGLLNGVWRCESPFDEFFKRYFPARVANLLPLNSFAEQELKGSGLLQQHRA
jgi:hypothetical protein